MIETIKRKKGDVHRARVLWVDGTPVSQTFDRKTDAKEWERKKLDERDKAKFTGIVVDDSYNFSGFSQKWIDEKVSVRLSASSKKRYVGMLKNHLVPILGGKELRQVSVQDANKILKALKEKDLAPRGINGILSMLITLLNDAVKWRCLTYNPLAGYPLLAEPEQPDIFWSKEEVDHFLNSTKSSPRNSVYAVALNTGMRRGELGGLKWDRVNFIQNTITVSRSLNRYGLRESTKTGAKRTIPMNPVVRRVLTMLWQQKKSHYVFCQEDGSPIDVNHLSRDFKKDQTDLGFTCPIRFHDLRHTFASHFMMNGGNIYDLQKILGHTNTEMTQRYAHLSRNHLVEAIKVVSFGAESGPVSEMKCPQNVHEISDESVKNVISMG